MSSSRELLQKADLTISNLIANGGYLQPEDSQVFLRNLIAEPTILRDARVVEMLAPQRKINKIGFGTRILRAAQDFTALTQNQRVSPTTSVVNLQTEEVIAQVNLPYDVIEDNIERAQAADNAPPNAQGPGGFKDTILALIAERAALDLEDLCVNSSPTFVDNSGSPNASDNQAYMRLFTGWLATAQASGHVVDCQNAGVDKANFRNIKMALPYQYLRNLAAMRYAVSHNHETMWRDSIANRGTALGDSTLTGTGLVNAYGVPVMGSATMPDSQALLSNPKNLILGVQRQFSMEFDKDIQARVYIIVLTARVAVAVEEPDATALGINITLSD
jgi:hypothetical protein